MTTLLLILIILGMSLWGFSNRNVIDRYAFNPYMVRNAGQWDRFITHGFLHGDMNHLLINVIVLFSFAPNVEFILRGLFGSGVAQLLVITIFISAVVVASLPDFFRRKHSQNFLSVGASGGVAALIFMSIVFRPFMGICLYGIFCFPGVVWGGIYLAYSYYQNQTDSRSRVNHGAHIAGAIYGAGIGLLIMLFSGILF